MNIPSIDSLLAENHALKSKLEQSVLALREAKGALTESNEEILYYNGRFSAVESNRKAIATINAVLKEE